MLCHLIAASYAQVASGNESIQQYEKAWLLALLVKLLRHFQGDHSAELITHLINMGHWEKPLNFLEINTRQVFDAFWPRLLRGG